ncbi:adenylyltransferase/cytidyltransferase family protein, partial [Nocardioides alcanivorans]|uniref:adenylyltransferase/cytidyltransferase family protein n=1 Tax=Nocardioides alcanivorans TaxID=2897352 RepID=UPI001F30F926
MQIWRNPDDFPADLGRTVITIGNFDGCHLGHQHVLRRAWEVATELGGLPVVAVTFDPHPMAVLRPDHAPSMLTTLEERAALLAENGADHVVAIPFNR